MGNKKYVREDVNFEGFDNAEDETTNIMDILPDLAKKDVYRIPTSKIKISASIRTEYNQDSLQQLSDSIKTNGQLQPIVVYPSAKDDMFIIAMGHRRYKACVWGDIELINCIIIDNLEDEKKRIIMQAIENEQRENLSPRDREKYMAQLQLLGFTITEISHTLHKSKSWVSESLRVYQIVDANKDTLANLGEEPNTRDLYNARNLTKAELNDAVMNALAQGGTKADFKKEIDKKIGKVVSQEREYEPPRENGEIESTTELSIFSVEIIMDSYKVSVKTPPDQKKLGKIIEEYYLSEGYDLKYI